MSESKNPCPLCQPVLENMIWENADWKVIRVHHEQAAQGAPAFWRLIAQEHFGELSAMPASAQNTALKILVALERCILQNLQPKKINLASLGNMVPHVHWHIVARFEWDPWWPAPIWAAATCAVDVEQVENVKNQLAQLDEKIAQALQNI